MAIDFEKILRKRKPTGKDLGVLYLSNAIITLLQNPERRVVTTPLYTHAQFDALFHKMLDREDAEDQYMVFQEYKHIHHWLVEYIFVPRMAELHIGIQTSVLQDMVTCARQEERLLNWESKLPAPTDEESIKHRLLRPTTSFTLERMCEGYCDEATQEMFVKGIRHARTYIDVSYYNMKGYNAMIGAIQRGLNLEHVLLLTEDVSDVEKMLDDYNDSVKWLREYVENGTYHDEETKQRKLAVLNKYFAPFDYKNVVIPEEEIREVERLTRNGKGFHSINMTYPIAFHPSIRH